MAPQRKREGLKTPLLDAADSTNGDDVLDLSDDETGHPARHHARRHQQTSFAGEAADLLKLSVPIFVARLSWVGMKITDTALLGHVGTHYLSATALSDLWTQARGRIRIHGWIPNVSILLSEFV